MEYKINTIFTYNNKKYVVKKGETRSCKGCAFENKNCDNNDVGECASVNRIDNIDVIFKKLTLKEYIKFIIYKYFKL